MESQTSCDTGYIKNPLHSNLTYIICATFYETHKMHKQLLVVSCCWSVTALDGHALCVVRGESFLDVGSPRCTQSTTSPILHSSSSFSHSVILSRALCSLIMFQCLIISNRGGNRFPIVASQFEQPAFPALLYVMPRKVFVRRS